MIGFSTITGGTQILQANPCTEPGAFLAQKITARNRLARWCFVFANLITMFMPAFCTRAIAFQQWPQTRLTSEDIQWLKEHGATHEQTKYAYQKAFREASKILVRPNISVTEKLKRPPSDDKRDYFSVSRYWWPNPETDNGLPWIRKDGNTNPASKSDGYDAERLRDVARWIEILCIAYAVSEEEIYATRASEMLEAFFLDDETGMRPNFRFSGSVPGVADGRASGLIELRSITRILKVIHVLEKSNSFRGEISEKMVNWSRKLLDWILTSQIGRKESLQENNHGTFYDDTVGTLAMVSGRNYFCKQIAKESLPARMKIQFDDFGKQTRELKRTLSLHYSLFNLQAYLNCRELGQQIGTDVWSKKLELGIEYAARSVRGDRKWVHEQKKPLNPTTVLEVSRLLARTGRKGLSRGMTQPFHSDKTYRESFLQLLLPPRMEAAKKDDR